MAPDDIRIGVVGLGYVGLPLAVAFARHFPVLGFDVDSNRIEELRSGQDKTLEVASQEIRDAAGLRLSADENALRDCKIFIVTVPTPIDRFRLPDLEPLASA